MKATRRVRWGTHLSCVLFVLGVVMFVAGQTGGLAGLGVAVFFLQEGVEAIRTPRGRRFALGDGGSTGSWGARVYGAALILLGLAALILSIAAGVTWATG